VDPQLLWQCYDEIDDQEQDRRMKNWGQFVKGSRGFLWKETN